MFREAKQFQTDLVFYSNWQKDISDSPLLTVEIPRSTVNVLLELYNLDSALFNSRADIGK